MEMSRSWCLIVNSIARPLGLALLIVVSVPAASAQGIYSKAIEQAQRAADKESFGGEVNFPDSVARFFDLALNTVTAAGAPAFQSSPGFVKLADALRASGKPQPADALAGKLNEVLVAAMPQVAQAVRDGVGKLKLESMSGFKGSRAALTEALRPVVEPQLKEQLRTAVQQASVAAGLPAAFETFVAASGTKLPDPKAALATLEDQVVTQAFEHLIKGLAKLERTYRADPKTANDKVLNGMFYTLK